MKSVTIPIERWAALMEERGDLLAFKLRMIEGQRQVQRPRKTDHGLDGDLVRQVQDAVRREMAETGISQNALSRRLGINKKQLSLLLNHLRLKAVGKPTISAPKLAELARRFLPAGEATGG